MAQLVVIRHRFIDFLSGALVTFSVRLDPCIELHSLTGLQSKTFKSLGQVEPKMISDERAVQVLYINDQDRELAATLATVPFNLPREGHPLTIYDL